MTGRVNIALESKLASEIIAVGLTPKLVRVHQCPCSPEFDDPCFDIDIRQPNGKIWAQARHETAESIRRAIRNWRLTCRLAANAAWHRRADR